MASIFPPQIPWDKLLIVFLQSLCNMYDSNSNLLHFVLFSGYEVIGTEHIPEGPAVIVYYHGAFVLDYIFFVARLYTLTGRHIYSVADNGLYLLPGKILLLYI